MQSIRIIEIPPMKAVCSGPLRTGEDFAAFVKWFSGYHAALPCQLCPRDFMWFNERENAREWFYLLPENARESDCGGYEVKELPFGLYAVAPCLDADLDQAQDWLKTREEIKAWVRQSGLYRLHVNGQDEGERYDMFQIVSPGWLQEKGVSIEDLYVPIYVR